MSSPPKQALRRLREGNRRFTADPLISAGRLEGVVNLADLSGKQTPFAAVLGCSDSRVPVEVVFNQGAGQLFVVRVAGNVVGPIQVASLEFAVVKLGVRLIVVLGHSNCGAVGATLDKLGRGDAQKLDGHLELITGPIERALVETRENDPEGALPDSDTAVELNVRQSCVDLGDLSPLLAERVDSGALLIVGAVYEVESGRVDFLDQEEH